ncbi:MAG: hypothetical protein GAK43_02582 [Stenotrophomonas maltophilia]|nr:MAG: hypothetical protein GAK43_02582 [Stenotrophomonas maltophilia]
MNWADLWPHLLRPFWLLALPALGWLVWKLLHRRRRAGRWQLLLPAAFQPWLLQGGNGRSDRRPWLVLGLAWLLAVLALLGPSWQRVEQPASQHSDPLVVVIELTPPMLATDLQPSRLEQTRRKLIDLLAARGDAQTAIVVYAGSAHTLVPLSNDLATARNLLDALKPSIMPEPGQRADLGVRQARELLDHGAEGNGRILLITDGLDEHERDGLSRALHGKGHDFSLLAVGTPAGAPILLEDGTYLKDEAGRILLPRLDEASLSRFAQEQGGAYQRLRSGNGDLRALGLLQTRGGERNEEDSILRLQRWADQGYWLLLPLLLLAACAGRRGWLFSLALLMPLLWAPPRDALAFDFEDLWLRPDQRGAHLLDEQHPQRAARHFEDFRWRGLALYQAGDYDAAAQAFARGDEAADHYNRGNALAHQQAYEAAIDAYDQALERDPQLQAAQHNKALVQALLRERQEQTPKPNEGGAQQGQSGDSQTSPSGAQPPSQSQDGEPQKPSQQAGGAAQNPTQNLSDNPNGQATAKPQTSTASAADSNTAAPDHLNDERRQALEQWLRQIPDEPSELLRRKFWYQQQQRQEAKP